MRVKLQASLTGEHYRSVVLPVINGLVKKRKARYSTVHYIAQRSSFFLFSDKTKDIQPIKDFSLTAYCDPEENEYCNK